MHKNDAWQIEDLRETEGKFVGCLISASCCLSIRRAHTMKTEFGALSRFGA